MNIIDYFGNTGFHNCAHPTFLIVKCYPEMQKWEKFYFAGSDFSKSWNLFIWYKRNYFWISLGIASRVIKPTLGLIDPEHTLHMPERVVANSGFDVLWWVNRFPFLCDFQHSVLMHSILSYSHALESYTAIPYNMRSPCPTNPINRPAYQGSNPISDVWAIHALRIVSKYLKR